jgi:fructose-1,6-bisphosphatase/inositol monophosphatase family enzyme
VAAGALLLQEAGAMLTGIDGQAFDLHAAHLLCAATPEVHRQLRSVLARAEATGSIR